MSINTEADPGAPRPDLRKYFGPRLKAIVTKLLSLLAAKRTPPTRMGGAEVQHVV